MTARAEAPGVGPLALSAEGLSEIERLARSAYPEECCGLLVGRPLPDAVRVSAIRAAPNLERERRCDRYRLDPKAFLAVDREARRVGLDIVGIWHTHPDRPARPSRADRDAAWPGWSYLIASVGACGLLEVRSYRLADGRFVEQVVEVEPVRVASGSSRAGAMS